MSAREKSIFFEALEYESVSERDRFVAHACGDDVPLRHIVDRLLRAHDRSLNVLDVANPISLRVQDLLMDAGGNPDETWLHPPRGSMALVDPIGASIGNYRLIEKIGEGGFGQVFVAEQVSPVKRTVALKLLKTGMDSREVIARFEAERQALALMDHPNIARVFDAGQTASGQPFFVMELVSGVPLNEYSDTHRWSIRDRLRLFIDMCHAVQHAHQRGIIHRDLKPSNVMVSMHDSRPVVKVIDFGVAKAISEPLTDRTIYTRFSQMIGTPLYMSPEQAEMNGLDVDTRSDIYSLGVMLYELLTGSTPFEKERLHTASFDELRRIIREEEPPRPSARVSTLKGHACETQRSRSDAEQRSLESTLRGDLDWIVMKALEKDRERRYETANELARDVQRFLDELPVSARPPSTWYRFSKFAKRNKVMLTTASLILFSSLVGTAVSTWQAIVATAARAEADALRTKAIESGEKLKRANVLLDSGRANADQRRWSQAMAQTTLATELQPDHFLTWSGRASILIRLGAWRSAASDYAKALRLGAPANNPGWWGVPQLCLYVEDEDSYRLACKHLGEQIQQSDDAMSVVIAARSLCLRPIDSPKGRVHLEESLALIESGALRPFPRMDSNNLPMFPPPLMATADRRFPDPMESMAGPTPSFGIPHDLQSYAKAMLQLRTGHLEESVQCMQPLVVSQHPSPIRWIGLPGLAIGLQQLNREPQAQEILLQCEQAMTMWLEQMQNERLESWPAPWFDFIEFLILYREAHLSIMLKKLDNDVRLDQLEGQALARISADEPTK